MNKNDYQIRLEQKDEEFAVESLVRESFWNVYRPGCLEHYLLHVLRNHPDFVQELNLVLEYRSQLIGQAAFVRAAIAADDGRTIPVLMLGPICIATEFKRQGWGKVLLDEAFSRAAAMGFGAVCFEGNIDFYSKCGCTEASAYGIRYHGLPEGEDASFFLCRELIPGFLSGISGVYHTPEVYYVDEVQAEAFDVRFPPKEKLKLPGQLF